MTVAALAELISLYQFTPGRRTYALRKTRDLLAADDPLVVRIDEAIALDRITLDLNTRWQAVRGVKDVWPKEVIDLDRAHDRLWGALSGACSAIATGLGPDSDQGAAAGRIVAAVFSEGVKVFIHRPFVEQRERTDAWLARLNGDLSVDVEGAGVRAMVARLGDVNARFGELLDQRKSQSSVAFADVRDADAKGQLAFLQIVAILIGRHAADDDERARVLGPILEQNAAIGELYKRNARVTDVDPNTGDVTEPALQA